MSDRPICPWLQEPSNRRRRGLARGDAIEFIVAEAALSANTATAHELSNSCTAHGGAAWDRSATCRALELMADYTGSGSDQ